MLQPVGQTLDQLRISSENRFGDGWTTAGFTAAQAALEVGGFLGGVAAIPGGRAALYGLGDSIQGGLNTLVDAMPVGSGDAARRSAAFEWGAVGDLEGANSSASLLKSESGGTLIFHENLDGHTLRRHVGKTDTELLARFQTEPDILDSSTYPNLEMAQRVVGETLQAQQAKCKLGYKVKHLG